MQDRRSNIDRSEKTRAELVKAARALFLEKGYAATSTPEVVAAAGLTRGALYHHFKDKQALFKAVVEAEAQAIAKEIEHGATQASTSSQALLDGARAYFSAMREPGRTALMLLQGPAVLGLEEMRRIDLETGGEELRIGIREALGAKATSQQIETYADLISAMFDRAALASSMGANNEDYAFALDKLLATLVKSP